MSNNKMERLNGEIRDREKVFRGLKRMDAPVLDGMKVTITSQRNTRCIKGKTPAQAPKTEIDGANRWKPIIQNTSLNKATE